MKSSRLAQRYERKRAKAAAERGAVLAPHDEDVPTAASSRASLAVLWCTATNMVRSAPCIRPTASTTSVSFAGRLKGPRVVNRLGRAPSEFQADHRGARRASGDDAN